MDYKFLLISVKNILLDPSKTWETIDTENRPIKVIRNSYLFPLLILVTLSSIAGSLLFMNIELSPVYSVFEGLRTFLSLLITVYLSALIFKEITYPLDLGRDFNVSFRIITFSLTPFFLTLFISTLFESLLFVNILALFGLYILYAGAEQLLSPPQHKRMPLVIATFITIAVVYSATDIVLNKLTEKIFYAFFA